MSELTLDQHLSGLYSARHGLAGATKEAEFVKDLKEDPVLRQEAMARKLSLVDDITVKDYVSRVHKAILESALHDAGVH